jgi:hypothetical protein
MRDHSGRGENMSLLADIYNVATIDYSQPLSWDDWVDWINLGIDLVVTVFEFL